MDDDFEERIARLERRQYADRCAIVALAAMLVQVAPDDCVREAFVSWASGLPEDAEQIPGAFEEAKELFVTLAALAENIRGAT